MHTTSQHLCMPRNPARAVKHWACQHAAHSPHHPGPSHCYAASFQGCMQQPEYRCPQHCAYGRGRNKGGELRSDLQLPALLNHGPRIGACGPPWTASLGIRTLTPPPPPQPAAAWLLCPGTVSCRCLCRHVQPQQPPGRHEQPRSTSRCASTMPARLSKVPVTRALWSHKSHALAPQKKKKK